MRGLTDYVVTNQRFLYIDSVVYGYGESSFEQILSDIKTGMLKKYYKSFISYSDIFKNCPDFGAFKPLDFFKISNYEVKKRYFLNFTPSSFKNLLIIPYSFTVGCFWNRCAYCGSSNDDFNRKLYVKSIDKVISDIKVMKEKHSTDVFIFYNQQFNQSLSYSKRLLKEMIKAKLRIKWMDMFNIINIDDEMIDLLKLAGCIRMDIGVSILNPMLQKFYSNILQDNSHFKKIKKISEKGIWVDINIIANMPHDFDPMMTFKY